MIVRKFIGKCIYCGSLDGLSEEHAFPFSINGDLILVDASCPRCSKITGQFEQRVTRDMWKPVRAVTGMKTRRPKEMPKQLPIKLVKEGKVIKTVEMPVSEFPAVLPLLELGAAGKYKGDFHAKGLNAEEHDLSLISVHPNKYFVTVTEKFDVDGVELDFGFYPDHYKRMLCKIAYCCAVARYGIADIAEAYVVPAILGERGDAAHWVGGDGLSELHVFKKEADHFAYVAADTQGVIHVRLKLFKNSQAPEYYVIVGRLSERMKALFDSLTSTTHIDNQRIRFRQ